MGGLASCITGCLVGGGSVCRRSRSRKKPDGIIGASHRKIKYSLSVTSDKLYCKVGSCVYRTIWNGNPVTAPIADGRSMAPPSGEMSGRSVKGIGKRSMRRTC